MKPVFSITSPDRSARSASLSLVLAIGEAPRFLTAGSSSLRHRASCRHRTSCHRTGRIASPPPRGGRSKTQVRLFECSGAVKIMERGGATTFVIRLGPSADCVGRKASVRETDNDLAPRPQYSRGLSACLDGSHEVVDRDAAQHPVERHVGKRQNGLGLQVRNWDATPTRTSDRVFSEGLWTNRRCRVLRQAPRQRRVRCR